MKKLFYTGLILLGLYEIANVYFIMPMPGSQRMNSIGLAYFLYSYRWWFRILFIAMMALGVLDALRVRKRWMKVLPVIAIIPVAVIVYMFNFRMVADHMFLQPEHVVFKSKTENTLVDSAIVVSVSHNGEAKAYPIRFIQYHHQVRDTVGGKAMMITYCNVCRTGRVFEPLVDGKPENFRLVGMDHFNAMFEDETTGSWWRQANGKAITGDLKGSMLPEVESNQFNLRTFFAVYPGGKVMAMEQKFKDSYDTVGRYEKGKGRSSLTRTDSLSWKDKSWVVGIDINHSAKAFDWFDLKKARAINDKVGDVPVVVVLASDDQSFAAFKRSEGENFILRNDSLIGTSNRYDLLGKSVDGSTLPMVKAYQEFWHSWNTFHPYTEKYSNQ